MKYLLSVKFCINQKKPTLKIEWENCYEKEKVVELLNSTGQI